MATTKIDEKPKNPMAQESANGTRRRKKYVTSSTVSPNISNLKNELDADRFR